MNQDSGQFPELDVGQTVTAEGKGAAVADHDGAWTSGDAGLCHYIIKTFLCCA